MNEVDLIIALRYVSQIVLWLYLIWTTYERELSRMIYPKKKKSKKNPKVTIFTNMQRVKFEMEVFNFFIECFPLKLKRRSAGLTNRHQQAILNFPEGHLAYNNVRFVFFWHLGLEYNTLEIKSVSFTRHTIFIYVRFVTSPTRQQLNQRKTRPPGSAFPK